MYPNGLNDVILLQLHSSTAVY